MWQKKWLGKDVPKKRYTCTCLLLEVDCGFFVIDSDFCLLQ